MRQPGVWVGIIPGGGRSVRLLRLTGLGVAAEAIITGRATPRASTTRTPWTSCTTLCPASSGDRQHPHSLHNYGPEPAPSITTREWSECLLRRRPESSKPTGPVSLEGINEYLLVLIACDVPK